MEDAAEKDAPDSLDDSQSTIETSSPEGPEKSNRKDRERAKSRKSRCLNMTMVEEFCVFCYGASFTTDEREDAEELLRCSECHKLSHPSCLELPEIAVENTKLYNWQCNDCKGCFQCKKKNNGKSMVLCDFCDRGFHTYCLEKKPTRFSRGSWKCPVCLSLSIESSKKKHESSKPAQQNDEEPEKFDASYNIDTTDSIKGDIKDSTYSKEDVVTAQEAPDGMITKRDGINENINAEIVDARMEAYDDNTSSKATTFQESRHSGSSCEEENFGADEKGIAVAKNSDSTSPDSSEISKEIRLGHKNSNEDCLAKKDKATETGLQNENKKTVISDAEVGDGAKVTMSKSPKKKPKKEFQTESRRVSRRVSGIPAPAIKESDFPIEYVTYARKLNIKTQEHLGEEIGPKSASVSTKAASISKKRASVSNKRASISNKLASVSNKPISVSNKAVSPRKKSGSENRLDIDALPRNDGVDEGNNDDRDVPDASKSRESNDLSAETKMSIANEVTSDKDKDSEKATVHIDNQNSGETPIVIKRKRGRPRRSEIANTIKTEPKLSPKKPKRVEKSERRLSSVLRKPPREPPISPANSKSVSSAREVRKVYPVRDRDQPRSVASPRVVSSAREPPAKRTPLKSRKSDKRELKSPKTTKTPQKLPKTIKSPPKTPTRSSPRTSITPVIQKSEKQTTPKIESKNIKSTPLKRSLAFSEKKEQDSAKKRKLSSPENNTTSKRPKTAESVLAKATRRRSKKDELLSAADATDASVGLSDIERIVSSADVALFEQAQFAVKNDCATGESSTMDQGIKKVDFGDYEIDTWYSSPYPSEYKIIGKVFICEYCLKYMKSATILRRHMAKCLWRHPPGDEIYRKDNVSVFEVDGEKSPTYCQNLCLLAKLFLDHKTLYYEVEPFLFYVMTIADSSGCHIVGYFSKEKVSFLNYNVSCILVLPHYMRKGYGNILIDFSYLLSRAEGKIGSPERPLSDLGLISYRSYWKHVLFRYLSSYNEECISIKEMSQKTAVLSNDLISTMQALGILKYWKGEHVINLPEEMLDAYLDKFKSRKLKLEIDESCLRWTCKDYGQGKNKQRNT